MKIILDAMGGDHAPEAPVLGAVQAARDFGAQITLVGRGDEILEVMRKHNIQDLPVGMEIANADEVVDMHDDPANVIRKKKNSSMVIGLKMVADGEGDAFVSAGSTGALLSGATLLVKRVKGIRRAAMGPVMPNKAGGKTVILDCGANAECPGEFLLQFGLVGSLYAKKYLGVENPKVGLLNIGTEDTKGTPLQKEAYALLTQASEQGILNFVGNVEARDVPLGAVDVVVCDGFVGNVALKLSEGLAKSITNLLKRELKSNGIMPKLGAMLSMPAFKSFKKVVDYAEYGGAPLLGLKGIAIVCHGKSNPKAICSAVKMANSYIAKGTQQRLVEAISANEELSSYAMSL